MLLNKLSCLNLVEGILSWVKSYLSSRVQKVYANNVCSSYRTTTQGVPQGLVFGPLFYIIYANDLVDIIPHCTVVLYADDMALYAANKNFELSVSYMQRDINAISVWCESNGIYVNTDKSKVMILDSKNTLKKIPAYEIKP